MDAVDTLNNSTSIWNSISKINKPVNLKHSNSIAITKYNMLLKRI